MIASKKGMQMNWQKFTKWLANIGILALVAIILLAIPMFRDKDSGYVGREAYFFARIAPDLPDYDPLSYSGREAAYNIGLPYILNNIPEKYWLFVPFAFAFLSIIIFWQILRRFNIGEKTLVLLILGLSPTFIFLSTTLNRFAAPLFLLLLSFLLAYSDNKLLRVLGIATLSVMPLFDFVFSLVALVIFMIFAFIGRKSRRYFLAGAILLSVTTSAYFFYLSQIAGWPALFNPERHFFGFGYELRLIISDFGGYAGISLIGLILSVIGVSSVWQNKYLRKELFLLTAILIALSFFLVEAVIILSLLVATFAYIGFEHLLKSEWSNNTLKLLVLIIFACGIIFSSVSYTKELAASEPNEGILSAMQFLKSKGNGVVFSDYSRGNWISYSGKKNMLDQNFLFAPDAEQRYQDSIKLLTTRDYSTAASLFRKYNIKYIWIDEGIKNKFYSSNEEGLLFLMKYSSNITKIYNQDDIQIWEIRS